MFPGPPDELPAVSGPASADAQAGALRLHCWRAGYAAPMTSKRRVSVGYLRKGHLQVPFDELQGDLIADIFAEYAPNSPFKEVVTSQESLKKNGFVFLSS